MSGAQKQQPSFANVKAPEGKGYYNALGLEFDCTPTGAARTSPLGTQSPCAAAAVHRAPVRKFPLSPILTYTTRVWSFLHVQIDTKVR